MYVRTEREIACTRMKSSCDRKKNEIQESRKRRKANNRQTKKFKICVVPK